MHLRPLGNHERRENRYENRSRERIPKDLFNYPTTVKKRLKLQLSIHTLHQIVEVGLFEKIDIIQVVIKAFKQKITVEIPNQLNLFGS